MNPLYYTTAEETQKVIDFLNKYSIGGGYDSPKFSNFLGPFRVPDIQGKQMVGLVLKNGTEMNAGLVLDLMVNKGYPEHFVAGTLQAMATGR